MEENNFLSYGRQNRDGFRQKNRGGRNQGRGGGRGGGNFSGGNGRGAGRGGRGSGRGGQFQQSDRKRHRSRSPADLMYHRPRFDQYFDNSQSYDNFQPPSEQYDMPQMDSYYISQDQSSFGQQQDQSNNYPNHFGGSNQQNRPHNQNVDFGDEFYWTGEQMQMDDGQYYSQNYGKRQNGRGRGNFNRGGSSKGSNRGNFSRNWNDRGSYRGNNFNQRGGNRGYQGGQNQGGRQRGQSTWNMQPEKRSAHSLAKLAMPDPTTMSIAEKVKRFGLFLKTVTPKSNAIQTIQNALSASKLMMTADYDSTVLLLYAGRPMFTGCLHIGGQFIVRAVGPTKKEVKHDVYNQALEILTTESVPAILSRADRPDELKETLLENLQKDVPEADPPPLPPKNEFEAAVGPLITSLKTLIPADNSISALEQARSMSHCTLKFYCRFEECDSGKRYFRSSFFLDNTLIAIGYGKKKKQSKHTAYENAVKGLTTKTFEELESGEDVMGSAAEAEWLEQYSDLSVQQEYETTYEEYIEDKTGISPDGTFNLEAQLTKLVDQLKEYIFKINNVHKIDCLSVKLSLSPVCVYKKLPYTEKGAPVVSCDLYINDIFIASGESLSKKEAQLQTYQKAWEFLTTTPVTSIISEQPRKPEIKPEDPSVIEVVLKGAGKYGDSNIERLGRFLINVYENWKSVDEIVIMEHVDWIVDRERHAFGILSQSATQSGLLMEWKIIKDEEDPKFFKCSMFLQKEEVACGKDCTKNGARNKASSVALNKFYKTQPIVQVSRGEDTTRIYSWENIQENARAWTAAEGESLPLDASDELISEHTLHYCEYLLKQKLEEDTLEGIIFRAGMTLTESKALKHLAGTLKIKSEIHQNAGQPDIIMSKKLTPDVMVKCLQRNNNRSGRYVLLTDEERPHLIMSDTESKTLKHLAGMLKIKSYIHQNAGPPT